MCQPGSIIKWTPSRTSFPGGTEVCCEINSIRACLAWTCWARAALPAGSRSKADAKRRQKTRMAGIHRLFYAERYLTGKIDPAAKRLSKAGVEAKRKK